MNQTGTYVNIMRESLERKRKYLTEILLKHFLIISGLDGRQVSFQDFGRLLLLISHMQKEQHTCSNDSQNYKDQDQWKKDRAFSPGRASSFLNHNRFSSSISTVIYLVLIISNLQSYFKLFK